MLKTLASDLEILDVGCGTGTNAREIKSINPNCKITGINKSEKELQTALKWLDQDIAFNLNSEECIKLDREFDLIICSHILEHLIDPALRVLELSKYLKPTGRMILLVPNFAIWKSRFRLLSGKFEYAKHGLYDSTHLRFYTWNSFVHEVVPNEFEIIERLSSGNFPMPFLRNFIPNHMAQGIDNFFIKKFPNLFSSEIGLVIKQRQS